MRGSNNFCAFLSVAISLSWRNLAWGFQEINFGGRHRSSCWLGDWQLLFGSPEEMMAWRRGFISLISAKQIFLLRTNNVSSIIEHICFALKNVSKSSYDDPFSSLWIWAPYFLSLLLFFGHCRMIITGFATLGDGMCEYVGEGVSSRTGWSEIVTFSHIK